VDVKYSMQSAVQKYACLMPGSGGRCKNASVRGKGKIFSMWLNFYFKRPSSDVRRVNPDDRTLGRFKKGS
jgi:hypothetical protein